MRVPTSTYSNNLLLQLNKLSRQQQRLETQLASQQQVRNASDNPAHFGEIVRLQSRERSMVSYRDNLDRGATISALSNNHLSLLQSSLTTALGTANLSNADLLNAGRMEANAKLVDTLIEQALEAIKGKHQGEYLFSGQTLTIDPFDVSRNDNGQASIETGMVKQGRGAPIPTLVKGNLYRIENAGNETNNDSVDFTSAGALTNQIGTVFEYNGGPVTWVPGGNAALTAIADNINQSSQHKLTVGGAYEIVSTGRDSEFRNAGALSNRVGSQFIFNGTLPANWDGAELAPLVLNFDKRITEEDIQDYEFYRVNSTDATIQNQFASNAIRPDLIDQNANGVLQYNGTLIGDNDAELVKLTGLLSEGDFTKDTSGFITETLNADQLIRNQQYMVINMQVETFAQNDFLSAGTSYTVTTAGNYAAVGGGAAAVPGDVFTATTPGPLTAGLEVQSRLAGGGTTHTTELGDIFTYDGSNITNFNGVEIIAVNGNTNATGDRALGADTNINPTTLTAADTGKAFMVIDTTKIAPTKEANNPFLTVGSTYIVSGGGGSISGGGINGTGTTGETFEYDGTGFADIGAAKLIKVDNTTLLNPNGGGLVVGSSYTIVGGAGTMTGGGVAGTGTNGESFVYQGGAFAAVGGATVVLANNTTAGIAPTALTSTDVGKQYIITPVNAAGNSTLAGGGVTDSAFNTSFTYDGTAFTAGTAVNTYTSGAALVAGVVYQVTVAGDYSGIGGPAAAVVGDQFASTGASLPTDPNTGTALGLQDAAVTLIEVDSTVDVNPTTLTSADKGKAYMVYGGSGTITGGGIDGTGTAGETFIYNGSSFSVDLKEGDSLVTNTTYTVQIDGDYSAFGGSAASKAGDTFVATGTGPLTAALSVKDPALGNAKLIEVATTGLDGGGLGENGVSGTRFVYDGTAFGDTLTTYRDPSGVDGGIALVELVDEPTTLTAANNSFAVAGQRYTVTAAGAGTDYSAIGGPTSTNSIEGYTFTATATSALTALVGNPTASLSVATDLQNDKLYKIAEAKPLGAELPTATFPDELTIGTLYRIESIGTAGATQNLAGVGGPAGVLTSANVGDTFVATGTTLTSAQWQGAVIKPLAFNTRKDAGTKIVPGSTVVLNEAYRVTVPGDFSSIGGPSNGRIGDVFSATAGTLAAQGGEAQRILSGGDSIVLGKAYRITTNNETVGLDWSAMGGPNLANSNVGDVFVATTNNTVPAGGSVEEIMGETYDIPMVAGDTYMVSKVATEVAAGTVATVGQVYQVSTNAGDWSAVGGPVNAQIGDVFKATVAAALPGNAMLAQSRTLGLGDDSLMIEGKLYTVTDNGSNVDFSSVAAGAVTKPDNGAYFTFNGALTQAQLDALNFNGSIIQGVVNGITVTASKPSDLYTFDATQTNAQNALNLGAVQFQVIDNGSSMDFTASGAVTNNLGTVFAYNGTAPSWGTGKIEDLMSVADYTTVGGQNVAGTVFTVEGTNDPVQGSVPFKWGKEGTVYKLDSARSVASDFRDVGAVDNREGTQFVYNGKSPQFDNKNDGGGTLVGYERQVAAAAYTGSKSSNSDFYVAEQIKLSPYLDVDDNQSFTEVIDSLIELREAYTLAQKAAEAGTEDNVTRFIAADRLKTATQRLDTADENVKIAINNIALNDIALDTAGSKDDAIHNNINKLVDTRRAADSAETIAQLTQSINQFQATIEATAQITSLNLFSFL